MHACTVELHASVNDKPLLAITRNISLKDQLNKAEFINSISLLEFLSTDISSDMQLLTGGRNLTNVDRSRMVHVFG